MEDQELERKAARLTKLVNELPTYESRKFKLENSANFKFAINKAHAMHEWIYTEWIPRQPDKKQLMELIELLNYRMADFCCFVALGELYWERLEAQSKLK
jgi:hypothetical protein